MKRLLPTIGLLLFAASASAQGIILLPEPPMPRPMPPGPPPVVFLRELRLEVRIEGQTAITKIQHTFYNPSNLQLEGTFYHPLPREAAVTDFSLWVGGVKTPGEILPRDQARGIYEDIVRRRRDPGLLEFVGTGLIQCRIFPILPRSEQKVEIEYAEVLKSDSGLSRYAYPLRIHRGQPHGVFKSAVFQVNIDAAAPLRSVYSPSHEVEIRNDGDRKAIVGFESNGAGLDRDFVLYTSVAPGDLAIHLLTDRLHAEEGHFMLLLAPPRAAGPEQRLPKDIVFVVDTSGSMREEDRISRAKRILSYGLKGLGEKDRFGLITFGTSVYPMSPNLLPATPENVARAVGEVDRIVARGGTHISEALMQALKTFGPAEESRRPRMIVFITDGRPTVGVTNPDELLALVSKNNPSKVRVFAFGVGVDLNTRILDELSSQNFGTTDYLDAENDMELAVSSFFDKVDFPALSDVELKFEGIDVYDLYPSGVSDLFFGEQLTILGRFKKPGAAKLIVHGWKEDKEETYTFDNLEFAKNARHDFVPRLWAARRIGFLLEEIRRNGENKELVDEIVELGQRYGIPSPYASFLVVEDSELEARGNQVVRPSSGAGEEAPMMDEQKTYAATPSPAATESDKRATIQRRENEGAGAVAVSKDMQRQQRADNVEDAGPASGARQVGSKTFYSRNGVWVQAELLDAKNTPAKSIRVQSMGKGYFELASQSDDLSEILAVGERVRFIWNGVAVEVGPEGEDELSAETRKLLGLS